MATAPSHVEPAREAIEIRLTLRGKNVFTAGERDEILQRLEQLRQDELARARASRRLRTLRFLVSDWTTAGTTFGPSDFDRLVSTGYITILDDGAEAA